MNDVDELITQLGYMEMTIAVGAFRQSLAEYCLPELADRGFEITDAYHPLIPDAVRNSVSTEKGVLITGSNASGKSTFLKMVALNVILAQTIHTCTAKKYKAPLYQIYSSMSLRDDLSSGESYYIVEIKALKRIVDAAAKGEKIICFVDEVLRGTNTVERISASTQILRSLSGKGIICFAATHDIELTELLKHSYDNYHFEEEIKEGDVVFHYQLLPGKATTRNAIKLLLLMGFEQGIIEDAIRQSELFEETGFWTLPEA
jgi:DNA mismatch repair ATPase MutS